MWGQNFESHSSTKSDLDLLLLKFWKRDNFEANFIANIAVNRTFCLEEAQLICGSS